MHNNNIINHYLLLLFFSFASISLGIAQERKVEFGLRAGGTVSTLAAYKKSNAMDASSYSGADRPVMSGFGELVIGVNLANNLAIRTGLMYSGKGGSYNNYSGYEDSRFYYGSVPVTLVKNFGNGKSSFYAGGGVYAGYLMKGMEKNRQFGPLGAPIDPPIYSEKYRRLDFGLKLAAGHQPLTRISFDLGYEIGLNNTLLNESNNWLTNQSLSIGVGYRFN